MNRENLLNQLKNDNYCRDILIIGGGATGLGIAMNTASRGFKTVLLEQHDFAKGTSSRSTKLVHGGARYLVQGDIFGHRRSARTRDRIKRKQESL